MGGLLCTADGSVPTNSKEVDKIWSTFRNAGIEPWELFVVNNDPNAPGAIAAGTPPLDYYRKEVLAKKKQILYEQQEK